MPPTGLSYQSRPSYTRVARRAIGLLLAASLLLVLFVVSYFSFDLHLFVLGTPRPSIYFEWELVSPLQRLQQDPFNSISATVIAVSCSVILAVCAQGVRHQQRSMVGLALAVCAMAGGFLILVTLGTAVIILAHWGSADIIETSVISTGLGLCIGIVMALASVQLWGAWRQLRTQA